MYWETLQRDMTSPFRREAQARSWKFSMQTSRLRLARGWSSAPVMEKRQRWEA